MVLAVPSELRRMMYTAPAALLPSSSPVAPTAMSGIPSPFQSPSAASDQPKQSSSSGV